MSINWTFRTQRRAVVAAAVAAVSVTLGFTTGSDNASVVEETYALPVAACTNPGADDGSFALNGTKLPAGGLTYKTNQSTFPAGLSKIEVQGAIGTAFLTWDADTSKALFTNGGTTVATPGLADGVNTVAFKKIKGSAIAVTTGWFDRKTKLLKEFDVALSSSYSWATNPLATGDCGGAAGRFDIRNVMTHEAGHAAGLSDVTSTTSKAQTMFAYVAYGELTKRSLADGDAQAVDILYGQ